MLITTELECAFVPQDTTDLRTNVFRALLVEPMRSRIVQEDVFADKVSTISMEFVPNVPKEPSGAPLLKSAFTSVDKTQPSLNQLENANVLKDTD